MSARISLPNLDGPEPSLPSTHELRRFLAGELAPERRAHIESLLATTASLKERLDALAAEQRADDGAFALEVPLPRFLEEHARRTGAATDGARGLFARLASLRFTMGAGLVAAGACAVFLMVRAPEGAGDGEGAIRSKGGRVGFLVREPSGARFGVDGEPLAEGAQIQLAVRDDSKHASMVVVGIDGRGAVTVYASERIDGRAKGPVSASVSERTRLLPESIVLDDATGAERFFVVYGDGDVDTVRHEVEGAARALASSRTSLVDDVSLRLPAGYTQSSVHILKVAKVPGR